MLKHFQKRLFSSKKIISARSKSTAEYCLNLVKQYDYENFVSAILLKNTTRSCAIAIRSFNVEIARVAEQVSQESIGLMRFQFWEETLDKCYSKDIKKVPQHPVALEIFKAICKAQLTRRYFNNLLNARKDNMNLKGFNKLEDLESYSEKTVSNVYYLITEGCGIKNVHADHAASHLGKAQGIVQQLRAVPQAKRLNFIPIPQDILNKHNLSQEDVLRAKTSEKLNECIFEIATRAHQHLVKSRSLVENVPVEARKALLPAVAVSCYLERLQRVDYDVFHPSLNRKTLGWFTKLWLTNFKNKY